MQECKQGILSAQRRLCPSAGLCLSHYWRLSILSHSPSRFMSFPRAKAPFALTLLTSHNLSAANDTLSFSRGFCPAPSKLGRSSGALHVVQGSGQYRYDEGCTTRASAKSMCVCNHSLLHDAAIDMPLANMLHVSPTTLTCVWCSIIFFGLAVLCAKSLS